MTYRLHGLSLLATVALAVGCASKKPQSAEMSSNDKRTAILTMSTDTINQLYRQRGTAREEVMQAPGYAVFSDVDMPVLQLGNSEGYGAVFDNTTKLPTYMKMSQMAGASPAQLRNYRLVFVFPDRDTMRKFVQQGWQFGADTGPGNTTAAAGQIKVYQLTHDGVVVTTVVPLTRYWRYDELN